MHGDGSTGPVVLHGFTPLEIGIFLGLIGALLFADLFVFNRKAHAISFSEAAWQSAFYVGIGLLFGVYVFFAHGAEASLLYFTGFVIEKSLSVDNVFLFVYFFSYFVVPKENRHRLLFWGIFGALVFRAIFIALGAAFISQFSWILYLFGLFLIYTAYKIAFMESEDPDPSKNIALKWFSRFFKMTPNYHGTKFWVRLQDGVLYATPMMAALIVIETTDVIFAIDSIPAIFGITQDPFIIFTSNVMAILGLRALTFLLDGAKDKFHFLNKGLAVVLGFVGIKMLLPLVGFHMNTILSVSFILTVIAVSVVASLIWPKIEEIAEEIAEDEHTSENGPEPTV